METDTEVVALLYNAAKAQAVAEGHTDGYNVQWSKTLPVGVDKMAHYEGFAEVIEDCSKIIYDRTQKHAANYAVVSSSIKPVLALIRGWKAAATGSINGPYFAGKL